MPSHSIKTEYIAANGVRTFATFSHIISQPQPFTHMQLLFTRHELSSSFGRRELFLKISVSKRWTHTLGEHSTLRFDSASSKSLYAMRPHFMSLYYRLSRHTEQVFNSFYACIRISCMGFSVCMCLCRVLFLVKHKKVYAVYVFSYFSFFVLLFWSFLSIYFRFACFLRILVLIHGIVRELLLCINCSRIWFCVLLSLTTRTAHTSIW